MQPAPAKNEHAETKMNIEKFENGMDNDLNKFFPLGYMFYCKMSAVVNNLGGII